MRKDAPFEGREGDPHTQRLRGREDCFVPRNDIEDIDKLVIARYEAIFPAIQRSSHQSISSGPLRALCLTYFIPVSLKTIFASFYLLTYNPYIFSPERFLQCRQIAAH
jgi:hypothetical protein